MVKLFEFYFKQTQEQRRTFKNMCDTIGSFTNVCFSNSSNTFEIQTLKSKVYGLKLENSDVDSALLKHRQKLKTKESFVFLRKKI